MTVSNGDVLKCFLELVLADGSIAQNVYHFKTVFTDDQTDSAVSTVIEAYLEAIMGEMSAYLSDTFTINPSWLQRVVWDPINSKWVVDYLIDIFTPSFTHTNTIDPFPNQIAAVMVGNTDYPKHVGRKFLPGLVEEAADGSQLETAAVVDLVGAVAEYISSILVSAGNTIYPGVVNNVANLFYPFTDGIADTIVGTQRRRKPGIGA